MPGSCPSCRSEWWSPGSTCPDCGVELVDGPLPDIEPEADAPARPWTDDPPVHDKVELDLAPLDADARWRLSIELDSLGVPHLWTAGRLTVPADAVGIVEDIAAGIGNDADDAGLDDAGLLDTPTDRRPGAARVAAWLIDAFGGYVVADGFVISLASAHLSLTSRRFIFWIVVALFVAIPAIVWGRSIGKMLLGLRVERIDGSPIRRRDAVVRCAVALCPLWLLWLPWPRAAEPVVRWLLPVTLLAIAGSTLVAPEHRGLPDTAAGTVVRRTLARGAPY